MDPIEVGADFIAHYGVKGMKWGVRKNRQGKEARETRRLRHADDEETGDESVMTLNAIRDANFFIIDFEVDEEEMSQSDIGEDFIAHYGIKGMKWGVRKPRIDRGIRRKGQKPASKSSKDSKKLADVKQTILKTKTPEERAAESRKKLQDYKNDTEELRAVVDRMRLEAEYSRLTAPEHKSRGETGKKVVTDILVGATTAVGKSYLQYQMETAIRAIDPNYKPPKKSK